MKNSLFNFKDDEEREMFFIAIPVILFFGLLGYWLTKGDTPEVLVADSIPQISGPAADSDSDGVPDNTDRCINRPGVVANSGCPANTSYAENDNDQDGIKNSIDSCPETKGNAANNGCRATTASSTGIASAISTGTLAAPATGIAMSSVSNANSVDTDQDGFVDSIDKCADVAGADNGCPSDADNDGVFGNADKCPDEAGSAIDNGCPADSDNDGVPDIDDPCQMIPGDDTGCPADQDNDGVADSIDVCPAQPGSSASNGCPEDSDADGVADAADRCPDTVGDAGNEGCPEDTDNDGIANTADACPNEPGETATNGCPANSQTNPVTDSVITGVVDSNTDAVAVTEPVTTTGSITATEPATTSNTAGVADTDGDLIPDDIDECPTISGSANASGCPTDIDQDSVADADDLCPTVAGRIEWRGCPDSPDLNANTTISEQDQQILDTALAQVAFNSNSATLTNQSMEILQQVAGLLTKYPNARLEIRGHTDASGPSNANMRLSVERARSAANYIAGQGVDVTRLIAYGYGESQPIASNNTAAGKRTNRRVEFELKF